MKRKSKLHLLLSSLMTVLFTAPAATAQTAALAARQTTEAGGGLGYVFVAPGGRSTGDGTLHFGGGGDYVFKAGPSVGAELGYLGPMERLDGGFGVFSLNGGYHFLKASRSSKTVPFLTGGVTGIFRGGDGEGGFNFGGGVDHWFKERIGVRLEFRDNVFRSGDPIHYLNFRIGLTFR